LEVNQGWLFRLIHFNGANFFFIIIFLHFFKALFFIRWRLFEVWLVGVLIFILLIAEAFLGYSLVWAQIRFWAATVITSLLGVLPFFGKNLIYFV
jgi:quinol-cytochrome oxidoreductase complex cytochrome b subunit